MKVRKQFDLEKLFTPPRYAETDLVSAPDLKAIFFDSLPYRGKPTRVFAWLGVPRQARPESCPAVVLVHGGLGTAFADWVRLWVDRGYAAIAIDTNGAVPDEARKPEGTWDWPRHPDAGPAADTKTASIAEPLADQWPLHAVSAVILAHSLIRSLPEVKDRDVGLTGVSWGAVLSCLAAGLDPRFRWAAPVYGCGFLGTKGGIVANDSLPERAKREWLRRWDPAHYLPQVKIPLLFLTGTNDFAFPLPALERSIAASGGPCCRSVKVNLLHAHGEVSEKPGEIPWFADCVRRGTLPLTILKQRRHGDRVRVTFASAAPIVRAELNFTRATGYSSDRVWNTLPAELSEPGRAQAKLPPHTRAAYFNLYDEAGRIYSSGLL